MSDKNTSEKSGNMFEKLAPLMFVVTIVLAFAVGIMWQKVVNPKSGDNTTKTPDTGTTQVQQQQPELTLSQVQDLFDMDVIKFGDKENSVLFVEVSDPSCPFCSIASGQNSELNNTSMNGRFKLVEDGGDYVAPVVEMKKLVEEGNASYVYLYSPGHGAGEMGAKAMYCAYELDRFWEVHDLLAGAEGYALVNDVVKNDKTKSQELADFLSGAIDSEFMKECLDSGKYDDRLAKDTQISSSLGAQGTPFFAVNDTAFYGAYNYTEMKPLVDEALGE